jgi:hypothetical protein
MADQKTDAHLWDDDNFAVSKWSDKTKIKLEALRRTAEISWNRPVTIQEIADRAIDYAYKELSVKLLDDKFL